MSRVDITGQFNVDFAACTATSEPIKVDRQPGTISTIGIRNWSTFCDSCDEVLMPLKRTKSYAKTASVVFQVSIAVYVIAILIVPRIFEDFDYGLLKYSALFVYVPVLWYLYALCQIIKRVVQAMERVKEVCESSSTSCVKYTLESEHWGGCNKRHVKRYFILVEIMVDADVEQIGAAASDTFAGYFSTSEPAIQPASAPSFADMLK